MRADPTSQDTERGSITVERPVPEVAVVTMNRPERHNALTDDMMTGLVATLRTLSDDRDANVVVLTGAGASFCVGFDLAEQDHREPTTHDESVRALRAHASAVETLAAMPQVSVAAINGACAGVGFALAAACDIRNASASAIFSTGYLSVGLSGDFGGLWNLTRIVGTAAARDWYLRPRRRTAAEVHAAGFVSDVFDTAAFAERSTQVWRELAACAPLALRAIKENVRETGGLDLATYLDHESARHVATRASADAAEGRAAFLAKRPPRFAGR